ncbi:MAG: hypothetical protein AAGG48_02420 [Planctomycetota bacterium]
MASVSGCNEQAPIEPYTIPKDMPEELRAERDRMLAAIIPNDGESWFFKVIGPESAVEALRPDLRRFVETIQFKDGKPVLEPLPAGWRKSGGEGGMRFATLDANVENKQLNISVTTLSHQGDWDEWVEMNVNRWRGQLGLQDSNEKWASAVALDVAAAEGQAAWLDIVGSESESSGMSSPMFGGSGGANPPTTRSPPPAAEPDSRLKFDRPEGWRDGRMSSMRMAAFNVGPEDSQAELTVIPAGGDLRGNVARWLGQIRGEDVPDAVVDEAMEDAKNINVAGRPALRFLLTGEDASSGTAIDATIVPLEDGVSLFVKMTGPAKTVSEQSDAVQSFLDSLELNL